MHGLEPPLLDGEWTLPMSDGINPTFSTAIQDPGSTQYQPAAHYNETTTADASKSFDTQHEDADSRPFQCLICGRRFPVRKSLTRHELSIHGPRRFPCAQCDLTFGRNDLRARHIDNVHSETRSSNSSNMVAHAPTQEHQEALHLQQTMPPLMMPVRANSVTSQSEQEAFTTTLKMTRPIHYVLHRS